MSTIKSSNEDITINADGSGRSVKFQANGVEKASIDSSGNFTSTSIDATKLSGALPAIDGSALTGVGKVLQVVSTVKADTFSTTATDTNFVDITGLSVNITPSSATSKILVNVYIGKTSSAVQQRHTNFKVLRNSTGVGLGDTASNRIRASFCSYNASYDSAGRGGQPASLSYLDSPSSTSALTYKVQMAGHTSNTVVINQSAENLDSSDAPHSRTISTITVMEIGE